MQSNQCLFVLPSYKCQKRNQLETGRKYLVDRPIHRLATYILELVELSEKLFMKAFTV